MGDKIFVALFYIPFLSKNARVWKLAKRGQNTGLQNAEKNKEPVHKPVQNLLINMTLNINFGNRTLKTHFS